MKHNFIYSLTSLLIIAFTISACSKEERSPKLIVHVQEKDGTAAAGATVRVWPGENTGETGRVINEELVDKTSTTDAAGDVVFEFETSVVLDIDIVYYKNGFDTMTPPNPIIDTLEGHKVVKLESIRQKSEENTVNETVEVK